VVVAVLLQFLTWLPSSINPRETCTHHGRRRRGSIVRSKKITRAGAILAYLYGTWCRNGTALMVGRHCNLRASWGDLKKSNAVSCCPSSNGIVPINDDVSWSSKCSILLQFHLHRFGETWTTSHPKVEKRTSSPDTPAGKFPVPKVAPSNRSDLQASNAF
jgi:hypothetical protein